MSSSSNEPKLILAKDYKSPDFLIDHIALDFDLHETNTKVTSALRVKRNGAHDRALQLHGEDLTLTSIRLDNELLNFKDYELREDMLVLSLIHI